MGRADGRRRARACSCGGPVLFRIQASPFAPDDLDGGPQKTQRHWWELRPRDFVTLNIDGWQMGVGGDTSWGALAHREYVLWPQRLGFLTS